MDAHLLQWLNLGVRWLHVIAGIAWIGASFYFNWLNSAIAPPERAEPGIAGEVWSVHGGGFYRTVKYGVAPARLPTTLHWFIWEAYTTWLSGVTLLILVYYLQAKTFLVGPAGLSPAAAIAISISTLVGANVIYDALCRSPLAKNPGAFALVGLSLVAALAWGLTQVLSPRAAYIHVGAALGGIMAVNVSRVIIPSQRRMVRAMREGREPDPALGKQAALRSLHNNYFTLPVVFTMIGGHYPATYGHSLNWFILFGLAVIGAGTRHYFNRRNQGRNNVWILPAAAIGMVALALVSRPKALPAPSAADDASFAAVRVVIAQRCAPCHSSKPTNPGVPTAPQGLVLDTPEEIQAQASRFDAVAVSAQTMPLGNVTEMTDEERALLGRWIRAGAQLR
ncbi:MAG: hypothetical protein EXR93_06625 [Gemmatimonadetes bacterium]|nr:hypothetical protein [Gemmatimonadota bacterium]